MSGHRLSRSDEGGSPKKGPSNEAVEDDSKHSTADAHLRKAQNQLKIELSALRSERLHIQERLSVEKRLAEADISRLKDWLTSLKHLFFSEKDPEPEQKDNGRHRSTLGKVDHDSKKTLVRLNYDFSKVKGYMHDDLDESRRLRIKEKIKIEFQIDQLRKVLFKTENQAEICASLLKAQTHRDMEQDLFNDLRCLIEKVVSEVCGGGHLPVGQPMPESAENVSKGIGMEQAQKLADYFKYQEILANAPSSAKSETGTTIAQYALVAKRELEILSSVAKLMQDTLEELKDKNEDMMDIRPEDMEEQDAKSAATDDEGPAEEESSEDMSLDDPKFLEQLQENETNLAREGLKEVKQEVENLKRLMCDRREARREAIKKLNDIAKE